MEDQVKFSVDTSFPDDKSLREVKLSVPLDIQSLSVKGNIHITENNIPNFSSFENFLGIKVKKTDPEAIIPFNANKGDAGHDLCSVEDVVLLAGSYAPVSTGLAFEIPINFYGRIAGRSGLALKGVNVLGGVVDSGYRGEVKVIVHNIGPSYLQIKKGMKIAQIIFESCCRASFYKVEELEQSERAEKGFGSSG